MSALTSPTTSTPTDRIRPRAGHRRSARVALVVVGCLAGLGLLVSCANPSTTSTTDRSPSVSTAPPVLGDNSPPPWPTPNNVASRVTAAGLDLGPMGTAEHYHPHLRIVIDGAEIPVAANIGVDPITGAMSALHTHEPDGTLTSKPTAPARSSPWVSCSPDGESNSPPTRSAASAPTAVANWC